MLTPKFKTPIKSVELSGPTIAIDGTPVTGAELRERLGSDGDLVLQLSYLDTAARRSLARAKRRRRSRPSRRRRRSIQVPRPIGAASAAHPRARRSEDIVRIGGSVAVDADEYVRGDVVVIGGSATINGEVDGEVVVVAGRRVSDRRPTCAET